MCDKLHIFWVRHVAFVQLLEALFLYMQQQMPKYLVLSWIKLPSTLFPLFFVLRGCCQINENAPLP